MSDFASLKTSFEKNGQGHIFAGWEKLSPTERDELAGDCARVDFAWLNARREEYARSKTAVAPKARSVLEPAAIEALPAGPSDVERQRRAREHGEALIRAGKAAAFLVAGGQGSRLGFEGPKGCYPLGPISGKTLFQWHAEQIRARARRYGAAIPWYIMTSRDNHDDTLSYFEQHEYLGMPKEDVFFFTQDMVPSIDLDGRLFLASPSRLAMNPNGHGGAIGGLFKSGACDDMRRRGVEYICSFQVDNPLTTIIDPLFIGSHALAGAEMSSKVLRKTGPDEKIGLAVVRDGRPAVVEYSDVDEGTVNARKPDGGLVFWAGSIGIHVMNVGFVARVGGDNALPWHQALKNMAYFNGEKMIKPTEKNAIKFETFIFDAIPLSATSVNLEVRREHEFAPVKNAVGVDSAESCRRLMSDHFGEWLAACGVTTPQPSGRLPELEISPLYSLDAEELRKKVAPGGVAIENRLLLD